jgi:hypothetical protein
MDRPITVDQAIARGKRLLRFCVIAIFFIAVVLYHYVSDLYTSTSWFTIEGSIFSIIVAWLYRSLVVTKWRLWAFGNVRNVHELKRRAIQEGIISKDNSFLTRTEIKGGRDRRRWAEIQLKFNKPDLFNDDTRVPFETRIYYDKRKLSADLAWLLPSLIIAGLMGLLLGATPILFFLLAFAGYAIYKTNAKATNREPQIILNERGMQTATTPFFEWRNISNDEAIVTPTARSRSIELKYDHPNGSERFSIIGMDITWKELNKLLILYRGRYDEKEALLSRL